MKHAFKWLLWLSCLFLLSSCEVLVARAASDFTLTPETKQLSLARGSEARLRLQVSRPIDLDVIPIPISVRLDDPPVGVSAEELVIEPGDDDAILIVTATKEADLGGPETLELIGTNGIVTKKAMLELTVVNHD